MVFSGPFFASSKLHTFVPNLFKAPQKWLYKPWAPRKRSKFTRFQRFHNRFERLPKCVSWAPACSKVVELLFRRAQHTPRKLTISCQKYRDLSYLYVFPVILCMTCCTITVSFVRLDLKLHAFWYLSKIVRTHHKLTSLEWKLHGFFRVIFFEFKAPHVCPKFVQSSTAKWLYKPWAPRKRSKFTRF